MEKHLMEKVRGILLMVFQQCCYYCSSSHADNHKNNFLVLGEGATYGINGSFDARDKKFSINFSKANTKSCLSLYYNSDNVYLFVNRKEISKFNVINGNFNFPTKFFLGNIFNGSGFSVDYNAIDKSNILNIHKYLMVKINIK